MTRGARVQTPIQTEPLISCRKCHRMHLWVIHLIWEEPVAIFVVENGLCCVCGEMLCSVESDLLRLALTWFWNPPLVAWAPHWRRKEWQLWSKHHIAYTCPQRFECMSCIEQLNSLLLASLPASNLRCTKISWDLLSECFEETSWRYSHKMQASCSHTEDKQEKHKLPPYWPFWRPWCRDDSIFRAWFGSSLSGASVFVKRIVDFTVSLEVTCAFVSSISFSNPDMSEMHQIHQKYFTILWVTSATSSSGSTLQTLCCQCWNGLDWPQPSRLSRSFWGAPYRFLCSWINL